MPISADLARLLHTLPKAELHVHIEGTLEPELIFALARRNQVPLAYANVDALRAAYQFSDLQSFLDVYYAGASVLREADDFEDMMFAYLRRAAEDRVLRAEVFFDPQTHTARGVPFAAVIDGLSAGIERGRRELGVDAVLLLCFLRHLSEEAAFETLEQAQPHLERIVGVGLDSSERDHPPEKFERVFARCGELGLHRVAHAGEEGPPAYIRDALDRLGAERIDHGVRCTEEPALVQRLARERVPLTVCPLSNVKLRVFDRMQQHNLAALLDAGLCVTINSDDPAYFGGYVVDNWIAAFEALPQLTLQHAWQLAANSFEASFADAASKRQWRAALDASFAAATA
jgi:adenosine deaminase